eukprot:TRINITY_DN5986_c1_g1_i1.p1 TRINITY_DN5986_c1_g1~~TRINITY_DN5986_c1_g1_i1.p1  ORF type:complete len:211 (+),score=66.55 TRINITY_DN5986_c1_g1_i1:429-1061(+)
MAKTVSDDNAACSMVNPMTVLAFLDIAQQRKQQWVVHTAAASSLGRRLVLLARQRGVRVINVVRRPEQAAALRELGAEFVLNQTSPSFAAELGELCRANGVRLAFDAVGGALAGQVLNCLAPGGECLVYGGLSDEACRDVDLTELCHFEKRLSGFQVQSYIKQRGMLAVAGWVRDLPQLLEGSMAAHVAGHHPLGAIKQAEWSGGVGGRG